MAIGLDTLPTYDALLRAPDPALRAFCIERRISTVYLPLDGTRRHFASYYDGPPSMTHEQFLRAYAERFMSQLRELVTLHVDLGLRTIIILIGEQLAFSRGDLFMRTITEAALRLVGRDPRYVKFYRDYRPRILFVGTHAGYSAAADENGATILAQAEAASSQNEGPTIVFYTGASPSDDYVCVARAGCELSERGQPVDKATLIDKVYGAPLDPIDYSVFSGPPREWILPPLLWDYSPRFSTIESNLALSREQIITAIYYTAVSRCLTFDSYPDYTHLTDAQRAEMRRRASQHLNHLEGVGLYWHEAEFMRELRGPSALGARSSGTTSQP